VCFRCFFCAKSRQGTVHRCSLLRTTNPGWDELSFFATLSPLEGSPACLTPAWFTPFFFVGRPPFSLDPGLGDFSPLWIFVNTPPWGALVGRVFGPLISLPFSPSAALFFKPWLAKAVFLLRLFFVLSPLVVFVANTFRPYQSRCWAALRGPWRVPFPVLGFLFFFFLNPIARWFHDPIFSGRFG